MYDLVIVVPYRDRERQLKYFLENTWSLVKKIIPNSFLVVVEQEQGKLFNRGIVLNIGISEYFDKTRYFIFHDIDINPCQEVIEELYVKEVEKNTFLGILTSPYQTLGGIIKFNPQDFKDINGFPNNYWGWGVEDRVLYNRAVFYNKKIQTNYISSKAKDKFQRFR